jgi:hypothetical protein
MKTSIYDRIDSIPTPDLKQLVRLWTSLVNSRPAPQRHDVWGKCLIRACLILESRLMDSGKSRRAAAQKIGTLKNAPKM